MNGMKLNQCSNITNRLEQQYYKPDFSINFFMRNLHLINCCYCKEIFTKVFSVAIDDETYLKKKNDGKTQSNEKDRDTDEDKGMERGIENER